MQKDTLQQEAYAPRCEEDAINRLLDQAAEADKQAAATEPAAEFSAPAPEEPRALSLDSAPLVPLGYTKDTSSKAVYYSRVQRKVVELSYRDYNINYLSMHGSAQDYARWLGYDESPEWLEKNEEDILRLAVRELKRLTLSMSGRFYDKASCSSPAGIWPDKEEPGSLIYYTGQGCYLSRPCQAPVPVDCVRGRHVYAGFSGGLLPAPSATPLTDEEGATLFNFMRNRLWAHPAYGYIAAGWLGCSMLAGLLPVRPQVWINAPASTGKTFLKDEIAQILGGFAISCESADSTAAGIAQRLDNSSLGVLFDEAECRSGRRSFTNLNNILQLVRSSATGNNACVLKGSSDGTQRTYHLRSCFMFFSISNILRLESDTSRFVQLALTPPSPYDSYRQIWKSQEQGRALVASPDFRSRFTSRLLLRYADIEANRLALIPFLQELGATNRRAEIYAALFSVVWSLCYTQRTIDPDHLNCFAKCYRRVEKLQHRENDCDNCLDALLSYSLPWEGSRINVATLCSMADTLPYGDELEKVSRTLATLGLRWQRERQALLADAYSASFKHIFLDTEWHDGKVVPVLAPADTAPTPGKPHICKTSARWNGSTPRVTLCIPAELILADHANEPTDS